MNTGEKGVKESGNYTVLYSKVRVNCKMFETAVCVYRVFNIHKSTRVFLALVHVSHRDPTCVDLY